MKKSIIYFDPIGGVAGDMFVGAFLDTGLVTLSELSTQVNTVLDTVTLKEEAIFRSGIRGTKFRVITKHGEALPDFHKHGQAGYLKHHHEHHRYSAIQNLIQESGLSGLLKQKVLEVFSLIAIAEGKVHGTPVEEVEFHELGRDDALADILCAAYCIQKLGECEIVSGPPPLGSGIVDFSHGKMTVPAPAVLEILKNCEVMPGDEVGEMTTPTGAAILRTFVNCFGGMPPMIIEKTGYGHGTREYADSPNTFRIVFGRSTAESNVAVSKDYGFLDDDLIVEITANVDDNASNLSAAAWGKLVEAGAIDIFLNSYLGKKNRQGECWTVLVKQENVQSVAKAMIENLGTIGVRFSEKKRLKLYRDTLNVQIENETIQLKRVYGAGIDRVYPETDEVLRFAKKWQIPPTDALRKIERMILKD